MSGALDLLTLPAAFAGVVAALSLPALTGFPTWPSLARDRPTSTIAASRAAGAAVYAIVTRLAAPTAG
jgi:hypothetical protein